MRLIPAIQQHMHEITHYSVLTCNLLSPYVHPTIALHSSMKINRLKLPVVDLNDVCWPSAATVCTDDPSSTKYSCVITITTIIFNIRMSSISQSNKNEHYSWQFSFTTRRYASVVYAVIVYASVHHTLVFTR